MSYEQDLVPIESVVINEMEGLPFEGQNRSSSPLNNTNAKRQSLLQRQGNYSLQKSHKNLHSISFVLVSIDRGNDRQVYRLVSQK